MLSPEDRRTLTTLVQDALHAAVFHNTLPTVPADLSPALAEQCGAFVTLTRRHRLRGCIGLIEGYLPLAETVIRMAESAALHDPRFSPVRPDEWADLEVEISVLTPLVKVSSADAIILGEDGVLIQGRGKSGVFLPQVAQETGWDKTRFLNELCVSKAGLPADAWRGSECELFTFKVECIKVAEKK